MCRPAGRTIPRVLFADQNVFLYIMIPVPLYKYVDHSTLFEICEMKSVSLMQESVDIAARRTSNNDMKINRPYRKI